MSAVTGYQGIKERLLIAVGDSSYNTAAQAAFDEGVDYAVNAIRRYDPNFDETGLLSIQILLEIATDLGAGIFKRRHMPEAMDVGWWGQGIKKLESWIQSTYFPVQQGEFWFSVMDEIANNIPVYDFWIGLPTWPFAPDGFGGWLWSGDVHPY